MMSLMRWYCPVYSYLVGWSLFTMMIAATYGNYPVFDGVNQLRQLLIPAQVAIGSVIYRLRASDSDHDYPLQFDATDYGNYVVRIENLSCASNATHCQANVYLERALMVGQVYTFRFTVRDSKGHTTTAPVAIHVTDAPPILDINRLFPHIPAIIVVPEDTEVGTELEYVIVKRNPESNRPPVLEIAGATEVVFGKVKSSKEITTGAITLKSRLDYENRTMYKLQIFALEMYANRLVDSRNIAGFEVIMVVDDVQDTPPIFTRIPPITKLSANLTKGDAIMSITAEDGDRGNPRKIKYGLVSEGNPFTVFFNIDTRKGEISLAKSLKELMAIARPHQPVLLTVIAEEHVAPSSSSKKEPAPMSSLATVAFLLAEDGNTPPYFDHDQYVCRIEENSPQGTALVFGDAYNTQVHDDDMGKHGVFALTLEKNNGTFEISPNVAERRAQFTIRVRNKNPLDFEVRQSLQFLIVAKELGAGTNALSSTATVLVYLNDANDNAPKFLNNIYQAQIPEDASANSFVAQVTATDLDTGLGGVVHYVGISGYRNTSLVLNTITGVVTVASDKHGFDREESPEYRMVVQARDMEGVGTLATVPLVIRISDVNDETPMFQDTPTQFTLTADLKNFTTTATVKAIDKDAEQPNNIVRYEIVSGNYDNKFALNSETGELEVISDNKSSHRQRRQAVQTAKQTTYLLTVRAYDLGVPQRSTTTQIRICPAESASQTISFIVPGRMIGDKQAEQLIAKMTGATHVDILRVTPYTDQVAIMPSSFPLLTDLAPNHPPNERSLVVARIIYDGDRPIVDFERVYHQLNSLIATSDSDSTIIIHKTDADRDSTAKTVSTDSSNVIFWLLLIMLLIVIVLLLLLHYCRPSCYSNSSYYNRNAKNIAMISDASRYSKGVQVTRDGAESALANGGHDGWKVYGQSERNHPSPPRAPQVILVTKKSPETFRHRRLREQLDGEQYEERAEDEQQTSFIYVQNGVSSNAPTDTVYVQDVADSSEYRILDPSKLDELRTKQDYHEHRHHQLVMPHAQNHLRGNHSDTVVSGVSRDQVFMMQGNAEILRLSTSTETRLDTTSFLNQPDNIQPDKGIIMDRFLHMRNQSVVQSEEEENGKSNHREEQKFDLPKEDDVSETIENTKIMSIGAEENKNGHLAAENGAIDTTKIEYKDGVGNNNNIDDSNNYCRLSNIFGLGQMDENRNRLVSVQRDILLTKFLVEEQRRLLNQVAIDTQSLPGSLTLSSMATQTDRHRATQTDLLGLLRPEPRKAKSENDDSSDSDLDCTSLSSSYYKRRQFSNGRRNHHISSFDDGKTSRHKIKTPILEENENSYESIICKRQTTSSTNLAGLVNQQPGDLLGRRNFKFGDATSVPDLFYKNCDDESSELKINKARQLSSDKMVKKFASRSCSNVLDAKDVYTPRSLRSRLLSRRRPGSEYLENMMMDDTKLLSSTNDRYMNWYKTKREERERKQSQVKEQERNKYRRSSLKGKDNSWKAEENFLTSKDEEQTQVADDDLTQTVEEKQDGIRIIDGSSCLKMKTKNQQFLEKKSVFTIAYDYASTEHIAFSSNGNGNGNGSVPETKT